MRVFRLSEIGEQLEVSSVIKAKFQKCYGDLYDWTVQNYRNRSKFRQSVVDKLNYLLYCLDTDGVEPLDWKLVVENPVYELQESFDPDEVRREMLHHYFYEDTILWDVQEPVKSGSTSIKDFKSEINKKPDSKEEPERVYTYKAKPVVHADAIETKPVEACVASESSKHLDTEREKKLPETKEADNSLTTVLYERPKVETTPKEDLFLTVPQYPKVGSIDSKYGNIRTSLPLVPTKQCEVSVTTNVNAMTDSELLALYPKSFVRTRSPLMYEPREGITLDPDYGLLIPVEGFTDAQVRDCIIRYPHIFKLTRILEDGSTKSFYSDIEVDGELIDTLEVWKYLPEARAIDLDSLDTKQDQLEFIKEYAIRRYLLERDVLGVNHKYEIRGCLPEFMTLFMPARMYEMEGYGDTVDLARSCVEARVQYLASRNPRIGKSVTVDDCVFGAYCCNSLCDRSCPRWAQMNYLMMRNDLTPTSRPFKMKSDYLQRYVTEYDSKPLTRVFCTKDVLKASEVFSYIAVCNEWKGSAMRVKAFHLVFSNYIDSLQNSWSSSKSEDLQYTEMWSKSCNVLIVSGIDYINFKDYQSQLLLQLIQDREREGKYTIVVSPKLENLAGQGKMFSLMISKLKTCVKYID